MGDQMELRLRLCALINDFGTTTMYVARATHIDRSQLNKFKLGKFILAPHQVQRLDEFLAERGYRDTVKAFSALVQGSYDN